MNNEVYVSVIDAGEYSDRDFIISYAGTDLAMATSAVSINSLIKEYSQYPLQTPIDRYIEVWRDDVFKEVIEYNSIKDIKGLQDYMNSNQK